MGVRYTDGEIAALLAEPKTLPSDYRLRLAPRLKRGHKGYELDVQGASGNQFRILVRQSAVNALDFSVVLAVASPHSNQFFRLRRYNGRSHEHTNRIEGL